VTGDQIASRRSTWQRLGITALLALILVVYLAEANTRRVRIPNLPHQGDQSAYLEYARQMHETNYGVVGGRARMPGYPFLLSLIYEPGLEDAEFLRRGQILNIWFSVAVLLLLFLIYRRHFPPLYASALLAITAFPVFYYRAPWVQTEVLFYFASFCMFLAYWRMLVAPSFPVAAWAGLCTGLAHLLKASVLPAVALFTVCFIARSAWNFRRTRTAPVRSSSWREPAMLALVLATFLAIVFPYLQTSKRVFGSYFHNASASYYVWLDSWEEAKAFSKIARDRHGKPAVPPEQIPSASKYWREHSVAQILSRLGHGVIGRLTHNARLDGYYKYVVLLAGIVGVLALHQRDKFVRMVRSQFFLAVFLALFFTGYLLLFAWYEAISNDARFMLMLYLPFTFAASKLIGRLAEGKTLQIGGRRVAQLTAVACVLLTLASAEAILNAVRLSGRPAAEPLGERG